MHERVCVRISLDLHKLLALCKVYFQNYVANVGPENWRVPQAIYNISVHDVQIYNSRLCLWFEFVYPIQHSRSAHVANVNIACIPAYTPCASKLKTVLNRFNSNRTHLILKFFYCYRHR